MSCFKLTLVSKWYSLFKVHAVENESSWLAILEIMTLTEIWFNSSRLTLLWEQDLTKDDVARSVHVTLRLQKSFGDIIWTFVS